MYPSNDESICLSCCGLSVYDNPQREGLFSAHRMLNGAEKLVFGLVDDPHPQRVDVLENILVETRHRGQSSPDLPKCKQYLAAIAKATICRHSIGPSLSWNPTEQVLEQSTDGWLADAKFLDHIVLRDRAVADPVTTT